TLLGRIASSLSYPRSPYMSRSARPVEADRHLSMLEEMRAQGAIGAPGLADDVVLRFLECDPSLPLAIESAYAHYRGIRRDYPDLLGLAEDEQVGRVQEGYVNFYPQDAVNPCGAAGAAGPWIVSLKGAVIYDCGGYGMLGLGHAPEP